MREIKYRGKRIDNDEWVYGYYLHDEYTNKHYILYAQEDDECPFMWEVIPETLGQFTGLCDKNGKEIFEGDIINGHGSYIFYPNYEIKYFTNGGRFMAIKKLRNYMDMISIENNDRIEVIGNIYENPDLLEA